MEFDYHGIGMKTYGERDYWPDGSYVTTKWLVFGYLPIAPYLSMRISETKNDPYSKYDTAGYYVYKILPTNRKQVICTYAWVFGVIACPVVFELFRAAIENAVGDATFAGQFFLALWASIVFLPLGLRELARRRKRRKWDRMSKGWEPYSLEE